MEEHYDIKKLLALRKLTRAIADLLRGQMKEYLSTLAPLIRPKSVLGEYIQSNSKEMARGAEKAFRDLQGLYATVAAAKPFNLTGELKSPIEIVSSTLEMSPMEYAHAAETGGESKTVTVTSPLKWVLNYSGFSVPRLRDLLADRNRKSEELREYVLHYLVMHTVVTSQTGVTQILDALHFPISTGRLPGFGDLPITYISSSISTNRPPDDVIIESTEISGMNAFEEVVNIDDIVKLRDPLRERLLELVKSHGDGLLPS